MTTESPHVAVVTGASRGIGRAIARRLAADGIAVAAVSRSLRAGDGALAGSLEETIAQIEADGGRAVALPFDLTAPGTDRRDIIAQATEAFGHPVDIVVNNAAGPRHFDVLFPDMTWEAFHEAVQTNVWAAWDLAAAAVPGMRERGAGWILNISSSQAGPRLGPPYAENPTNGAVLYGGTKAFIDRITTGAAMELYEDNIAVNTLAPEYQVATDNALTVAGVRKDNSEPEETIAEAALALCTGDPKKLTGRIAYNLSLLVELERPVRTLDGRSTLPGWQPNEIDSARLRVPYTQTSRIL
ncbi:SDR family NAD(P)-dependent oxidoreductase [Nocardia cerradoensis]|uniref:3-oxoacyl-[acyl-carrier-protein] reductase FabG n=1 Tax=Nocardia cerradoensis TaxID=85688 RepID=A0A231GUZ2_9NOCA|nr:SDR family NAD(P)-dependent oxidoreductase [Nocardia cerradoensis]NKY43645.1 SDR family NAD(P)-dependent oxidoreductase [Nocardia cerradoensis]OXR40426.1 3-oxoacyl-[acyl-carrier-protein] reductase FabG [Nocardia cerradoensis]